LHLQGRPDYAACLFHQYAMSIHYTYTHSVTEGTTGYFSCEPPADLSFEQALVLLEAAPQDEFLHRHLLRRCVALLWRIWKRSCPAH